jgi:uncharacterized membrane protein
MKGRLQMPDVGHLWAVGFDDVSGADRVCGQIVKLAERHCLVLTDWTVAVRYRDGSFTVGGEPLLQPSWHGRLANFFASLALGAPPLTSAAVGAFTSGAQTDTGISDAFVGQVKELMKPGTSVLFVVDAAADLNAILEGIRGLGGTVLKTNVDLDRARLIQATLAGSSGHQQNDSKPG